MKYRGAQTATSAELVAMLADMPAFLDASFASLSRDEARVAAAGGGFSPVEQCWHLADLEREGYGVRLARLQSEDDPLLPDFDGDGIAAERDYRSRSLTEGLRAFAQARAVNLERLRAAGGADWDRAGRQEGVGKVSLCDVPAMMAEHDAAHRAEIEAWLQAHHGTGSEVAAER